jgi:hypothetical protein
LKVQIKKFLPGLLLGLLFIGVFMVGFNSFNPGNSGAATLPSLQTGQEVAAPQNPASVTGDSQANQPAVAPAEITPQSDNPVVVSQPDPSGVIPLQPDNSSSAPVGVEPVVDNPTVIDRPASSQESKELKESQEKSNDSKKHEREDKEEDD